MRFMFLTMISFLLFATTSFAQGDGSIEQQYREKVTELAGQVEAMEEAMKSDSYSQAQLGEYQYTYLQMLYYGKVLANRDENGALERSNSNPRLLLEEGYIPFWPLNPLSDWAEVNVTLDREELQAGDVLLEVCPAAYESMSASGLVAASFNLYLVATDPELASYGQMFVYAENEEWAVFPENAVYGLSYYVTSDTKRREAYSKHKTK